jgi:hypothetical protein cdivTM_18839
MKTERKAKISFIKMGTGKGCKVNLSIPLLKEFGINEDNREVKIIYDTENQKIIIEKV